MKIAEKIKKFSGIIYPLVALGIIILAWLISALIVKSEIIIPSLSDTFIALFNILTTGKTYLVLLNTLLRTFATFLFSTILGIGLGILATIFQTFGKILLQMIKFLRAVPTISVILLIIVWSDAKIAPILVAFLIIFPIIFANIYDAINSIDKDILKMCKIYKISQKDLALKVYVPAVLPTFFDTAKSTISLALKVVISAEVMAQTKNSIGIMMQIGKASLQTDVLLAWTIAAIFISYFLEICIELLKKWIIRWEK